MSPSTEVRTSSRTTNATDTDAPTGRPTLGHPPADVRSADGTAVGTYASDRWTAGRGRMTPIRLAQTVSTAAVASIAAWSSWSHMVRVALTYGERPEVAYVLPISVDGMLVVASAAMVEDKHAGRNVRLSARIAFLVGMAASVGADIAAASPSDPTTATEAAPGRPDGPAAIAHRGPDRSGLATLTPMAAGSDAGGMSEYNGKRFDRTHEAWSALAEQFTQIAHQFREHHHRVTAGARQVGAHPSDADPAGADSAGADKVGTDPGGTDTAGHRVSKAVQDAARAFENAVGDPKVRHDSAETGSALLQAVGATLSELGTAIQREADDKQTPRP